jgi:hypothetical protein
LLNLGAPRLEAEFQIVPLSYNRIKGIAIPSSGEGLMHIDMILAIEVVLWPIYLTNQLPKK